MPVYRHMGMPLLLIPPHLFKIYLEKWIPLRLCLEHGFLSVLIEEMKNAREIKMQILVYLLHYLLIFPCTCFFSSIKFSENLRSKYRLEVLNFDTECHYFLRHAGHAKAHWQNTTSQDCGSSDPKYNGTEASLPSLWTIHSAFNYVFYIWILRGRVVNPY